MGQKEHQALGLRKVPRRTAIEVVTRHIITKIMPIFSNVLRPTIVLATL